MTTPFLPISNQFGAVRYYTEFDPYIHFVDNRPLQDIVQNYEVIATASDAGRRASLLNAMAMNSALAGIVGFETKVIGLYATNPSAGVVALSPGALLEPREIYAGSSEQTLKQASLSSPKNLSCPAPATLGKEVRFLVQARFRDFEAQANPTPIYDHANAFMPSAMLNGWLEVSVLVGAEANTNASVAPSASAGWTPLYEVLSRAGETTSTIAVASGAPEWVRKAVSDSAWVTPSLSSSWASIAGFQPLQYRKLGDKVQIRGAASGGATGSTMFTLPAGLRPAYDTLFPIASTGSVAQTSYVRVNASGSVVAQTSYQVHTGLLEFYLG